MLTKRYRLRRRRDLERVFKKGKSEKLDCLIFKKINNGLNINRFAFFIGKKVSQKAVLRNKIKRRMSEIVRNFLPHLKSGFDGVFITLPGIEKKKFEEIKTLIEALLKKTDCFK